MGIPCHRRRLKLTNCTLPTDNASAVNGIIGQIVRVKLPPAFRTPSVEETSAEPVGDIMVGFGQEKMFDILD